MDNQIIESLEGITKNFLKIKINFILILIIYDFLITRAYH